MRNTFFINPIKKILTSFDCHRLGQFFTWIQLVDFTVQYESDGEDDDMSTDVEDEGKSTEEESREPNQSEVAPDESDSEDIEDKVDFEEEVDVARKVLNNLISSTSKGTPISPEDKSVTPKSEKDDEIITIPSKSVVGSTELPPEVKSTNSRKRESEGKTPEEEEEDLQRTIFICNLPFDVDNEEVKQRFSGFGEVQSFVPVLHQVTKYEII